LYNRSHIEDIRVSATKLNHRKFGDVIKIKFIFFSQEIYGLADYSIKEQVLTGIGGV